MFFALFAAAQAFLLQQMPAAQPGAGVAAVAQPDPEAVLNDPFSRIGDPCSKIECGQLICPPAFKAERRPGHCCPYCVNPNLVVEDAVKGVSGKHGGTASAFCANTFCFPTMCEGEETPASAENGRCCPRCESQQPQVGGY